MKQTSPHKERIAFAFLLSLLLATPLIALGLAADIAGFIPSLIFLITTLALYFLPFTFLRKRTCFLVAFPFFILSLTELVHIILARHSATTMWLYTMLISEGNEASELISVYFPAIIALLCLFALYFWADLRYVSGTFLLPAKWRKVLAVCASAWLIGICAYHVCMPEQKRLAQAFPPPVGTLVNAGKIAVWQHHISEGLNRPKQPAGAVTQAPDDLLVVLFIGEAARYDNWQFNGYSRPTTPLLMQRADRLISFDSIYTMANLTTMSVPLMLSPATPSSLRRFLDEPSVVDDFHEAGFHTAWIASECEANQFLADISGRCDYVYYSQPDQWQLYDNDLLEQYRQCLTHGGRQLLVLQGRGAHFKYSSRYPQEEAFFHPDLYDLSNHLREQDWTKPIETVRSVLVNSYDNVQRHLDVALDEVIAAAEQTGRPAVVLYLADHGENLLDDEHYRFVHGQGCESAYEFHVPMFVWVSDSYGDYYPEVVGCLQSHKQLRSSSEVLFHTLLQLGDVSVGSFMPTHSLASPQALRADSLPILNGNLRPTLFQVND